MTITANSRTAVHVIDDLPSAKNAVVRQRTAVAGGLTLLAVGLAGAVAAMFGSTVFFLFAVTLPAPLMVLWLSVDVLRFDERGSAR